MKTLITSLFALAAITVHSAAANDIGCNSNNTKSGITCEFSEVEADSIISTMEKQKDGSVVNFSEGSLISHNSIPFLVKVSSMRFSKVSDGSWIKPKFGVIFQNLEDGSANEFSFFTTYIESGAGRFLSLQLTLPRYSQNYNGCYWIEKTQGKLYSRYDCGSVPQVKPGKMFSESRQ
ncbi:MAG: hypothetical protein H7301_12580 [Cryobacterium sp.]|nr:hypothetical protein [Oligoflexia bacterium]